MREQRSPDKDSGAPQPRLIMMVRCPLYSNVHMPVGLRYWSGRRERHRGTRETEFDPRIPLALHPCDRGARSPGDPDFVRGSRTTKALTFCNARNEPCL